MEEHARTTMSDDDDLASWTRIGIAAGFVAVIVYPILIFASLPRIPQVALGASFGPALVVASVASLTSSRRAGAPLRFNLRLSATFLQALW
jgi:hypothetical protein